MIVAFSARASRTAASNARREIAWPVNGSRIVRTGAGRSLPGLRPCGGSQ